MADKVPETPILPEGPISPDVQGLYLYSGNLNRQLHDYLAELARKANLGDLTDGGVIIGDIDLTGDLNVTGSGAFSGAVTVADEAYSDGGWNGDLSVPTKNAIRDIWETLGTAAMEDIGTSGANVPLMSTANTWAPSQIFTVEALFDFESDVASNTPALIMRRSRGGPANVQNGDALGQFSWRPFGNGAFAFPSTAVVQAVARENHSGASTFGNMMLFDTTSVGAAGRATRMRIGDGVYHPSATGGDQGNNTLNFTTLYRNGNLVPGPASQAEGDVVYRGASDWLRLAKGTSGQVLAQNSGLTAPEWVGPDYEFVGSIAASSSAQIVVDSSTLGALAANYDYIIKFENLQPSADATLTMQYGTGGTPTYQNTGYQSRVNTQQDGVTTALALEETGAGGVTAGEIKSGEITVQNPGANARHTTLIHTFTFDSAAARRNAAGSGWRTTAEVVTGLRFALSTGNINSGTFYVWRRRIT